jgi:formyltetrahydrofolate deformylase
MVSDSGANGTEHVLTVSCTDRPGIMHAIASFLVDHGANVTESQQFDDRKAGKFSMRTQFEAAAGRTIDPAAPRMGAESVAALGRDTECLALAHAVQWHSENRVLLDGKRTVVFH